MLLATVLLAGTISAPPDEAPPGGYWTMGEQREREREPLDGEDELTIGSVLFSLGFLRMGVGFLTVWMAERPEQCPIGDDCSGLSIYGWVGVGEGSLLLGTGIVYLAIGATRRRRHQRWQRGEPLALGGRALGGRIGFEPWLLPRPETISVLPGHARGGAANTGWREVTSSLNLVPSGAGLRLRVRF